MLNERYSDHLIQYYFKKMLIPYKLQGKKLQNPERQVICYKNYHLIPIKL